MKLPLTVLCEGNSEKVKGKLTFLGETINYTFFYKQLHFSAQALSC